MNLNIYKIKQVLSIIKTRSWNNNYNKKFKATNKSPSNNMRIIRR